MLILAGTVLALLLVPVLGGQLTRLAGLRLVNAQLISLALALQIFCISIVPTWPRPPLIAMHVLSYVLAAVFVWRNRRLPGLPVLALGGSLNAVTIALNGGTLPASRSAMLKAGLPVHEDRFLNSGLRAHPHLAVFGDNYPSPSWLPLHNVYSIGDLLILVGVAWLIHRTCRSTLHRSVFGAPARYRALTSVRMEDHLDVLDLLDEARADRDDALDALEELGVRNAELHSELSALRRTAGIPEPADTAPAPRGATPGPVLTTTH
jgi:hypothetical protein